MKRVKLFESLIKFPVGIILKDQYFGFPKLEYERVNYYSKLDFLNKYSGENYYIQLFRLSDIYEITR